MWWADRLCQTYKEGFYVADLGVLYEVLEVGHPQLQDMPCRTLPHQLPELYKKTFQHSKLPGEMCSRVRSDRWLAHPQHVSAKVAEDKEEFVEAMCMLLGTCGIPFVKETASEEYRNFEPLCQVIRVLGRQLLQKNRKVQLAACQMLVAVGDCLRSGT
jgi:hypothetical protein